MKIFQFLKLLFLFCLFIDFQGSHSMFQKYLEKINQKVKLFIKLHLLITYIMNHMTNRKLPPIQVQKLLFRMVVQMNVLVENTTVMSLNRH
uniref:Uncharacterized protein n=1 Tax=Meloidogyne enterolobii TaxID=390850 RepID=A0A6V7YAI3_MELEN|nr:unnamed protein product [Meloidogyne enterolobii]